MVHPCESRPEGPAGGFGALAFLALVRAQHGTGKGKPAFCLLRHPGAWGAVSGAGGEALAYVRSTYCDGVLPYLLLL